MDGVTRRVTFILLGVIAIEGTPMAIDAAIAPQGFARLYYGVGVGWPAWLAALVVAVGYSLYAARRLPMIAARVFEAHPLKLLAVPMAVIAGAMEELWFRRQLMNWAQGQGLDIAAKSRCRL